MHEILKRYQIKINFLDSGCIISVGCKKFAFSLAATGIWELQQYSNDPEVIIRKWLSPEEAESIINPDSERELIPCPANPQTPAESYPVTPLFGRTPHPEPIIHNPQVIDKLINDIDNLIYPGGTNKTLWTYKKLFLLVSEAACVHENKVKPESRLSEDLGLDSLEVVGLFMRIESEFQVSIPDSQAKDARTVEDLHNIVLSHILNKPENERATPISDQQ